MDISSSDSSNRSSEGDISNGNSGNVSPLLAQSDELILEIIGHVPPLDVLRTVSLLNRRLASLTGAGECAGTNSGDIGREEVDERYWRSHPSLPERVRDRTPALTLRQVQRLCCVCSHPPTTAAAAASAVSAAASAVSGQQQRPCDSLSGSLRGRSVLPTREEGLGNYEAYRIARGAELDLSRRINRGRSTHSTTTDHPNEILENVLPTPGAITTGNLPSVRSRTIDPVEEDSAEEWDDVIRSSRVPDLGPPPPHEFVPTIQFVMAAMTQQGTYWSSKPANVGGMGETSETLAFATKFGDVMVQDVAIKPFRELRFEGDHQPYTWMAVVVRVYRLPIGGSVLAGGGRGQRHRQRRGQRQRQRDLELDHVNNGYSNNGDGATRGNLAHWESGTIVGPAEEDDDSEAPANGNSNYSTNGNNSSNVTAASAPTLPILSGHAPIYTSELYSAPPPEDCRWQHYTLPRGVVGNVVTFTLLGKNYRQFTESGYYVCVDRAAVRGVPL